MFIAAPPILRGMTHPMMTARAASLTLNALARATVTPGVSFGLSPQSVSSVACHQLGGKSHQDDFAL